MKTKHGHSGYRHPTATYRSWDSMKGRCLNPRSSKFKRYGGRGITVCERWLTFANFLADMGERPEGTSIDRIDNDRGYEPGNCRWATMKEQNRNRRGNLLLTYNGHTKPVTAWSEDVRIPATVLYSRISRGWTADDALTRPVSPRRRKSLHPAPTGERGES